MNTLLDSDLPFFDFGGVDISALEVILFLLATLAVIAVVVIVYHFIARKTTEKFVFTTKDVTYAAVCLTMAYALSYFGFSMPMGGTVTPASILPVAVYCYYFGFRKGVIVSTVFMLLQLTQQPWIVSVWSMLLDYIVPYFALSIIGIFSYNPSANRSEKKGIALALTHWKFFVGMLIYIIIRYASHVLSGVLYWDYSEYYEMTTLIYSMSYNSFCLVDTLIAGLAGMFVFSSKAFNKTLSDATYHASEAQA